MSGLFFKEGKFVENRHKLDHRIEPLFLGSKRIQQRIYLKYGGHRETKSFLRLIQHPADRVKLVLIDKALEEKIGRKLDGDLRISLSGIHSVPIRVPSLCP